ncbi:hypothetical protein DY000_02040384 [Brassica cretica]|uniref:Uncharacterized protein n=1 Tax=Brassica cretica TaxID=69181 RepID=A0ABQ7B6K2_BRACR|nr:hypothetical protein DY000_02040384 [Brassica cretica]
MQMESNRDGRSSAFGLSSDRFRKIEWFTVPAVLKSNGSEIVMGCLLPFVALSAKVDVRVFCEHIGLDLYFLLSRLDPNESLGIKIDQHREQYHDSGLFYLSDPSSRLALN